jgi:hypothetical protein
MNAVKLSVATAESTLAVFGQREIEIWLINEHLPRESALRRAVNSSHRRTVGVSQAEICAVESLEDMALQGFGTGCLEGTRIFGTHLHGAWS